MVFLGRLSLVIIYVFYVQILVPDILLSISVIDTGQDYRRNIL